MESKEKSVSSINRQIGFILSSHHEIINSILRELSLRDLNRASLVCKSWYSVVRNIKKNRTKLECESYDCTSDSDFEENIFKQFIIKPEQLPNHCLTFLKYSFYNRFTKTLLSRYEETVLNQSLVHSQLKKALPPNCPSFMLNCLKFPTDVLECKSDVVSVTFPQLKNIKMRQFEMNSDTEYTNDLITKFTDSKLKCVFLFAYSCKAKSVMNKLLLKLRDISVNKFVMGSYMLPDFVLEDGRHEIEFLKGLSFSGDNLYVNSIIIPQETYTYDEIEKLVLQLKHQEFELTKHNSLAFMFYERQRRCTTMDVDIFTRHFPYTNIVGIDVEDVLKFSDEVGKKDQLVSTIPRWQVAAIPEGLRICYTRFSGPSQITLLSWSD